mgnify:CR=1 FL=1
MPTEAGKTRTDAGDREKSGNMNETTAERASRFQKLLRKCTKTKLDRMFEEGSRSVWLCMWDISYAEVWLIFFGSWSADLRQREMARENLLSHDTHSARLCACLGKRDSRR